MTHHTLFLGVMMFAAGCAWAQEPFDKRAEQAFQQQVLNNRTKCQFKHIDWRPDAATAVKDAQSAQKPILVFIEVGKHGQKNAPDC